MDVNQYENRCSTFRHTYHEQVLAFVDHAEASGEFASIAPTGLVHAMDTR
jgi:hypothetical protein